MIVKKTFRFCLKPNLAQRRSFENFSGSSRWLYNHGLERKKKAYEEDKKSLSYYDLNNELPLLKRLEKTSWLKEIHSQVLQQSLKDLDSAFQHFFRRVKQKETPGYPRFKSKGDRDSFRYPQGVKVHGNRVYLPKIGSVCFRKSREIEGELKQTTIVKEAGKWYVCFSCEIEKKEAFPKLDEKNAIGIDVGLTQYATYAAGYNNEIFEVSNPRFLAQGIQRLRFLSRNLSRKTYKSQNWYKARQHLRDFQVRLKNSRKDFAHKLSTQIVKSHDIIGVESLSVSTMLQSGRTSLSRSIADASWRQFLGFLKYKALEWEKRLVEVDRWFASTGTCSSCGKKHQLQLSDRRLKCDCGLEIGRDVNAAINIKNEALRNIRAAGTSVLKLVELPR